MITQTFNQGENTIKIELAENPEDAKKHNFKEGEYHRYFINNKPVQGYYSIVQYIVQTAKDHNQQFIPDRESMIKMREDVLRKNNEEMKNQLELLKKQYGSYGADESILKKVDELIDKIDESGVRIKQ